DVESCSSKNRDQSPARGRFPGMVPADSARGGAGGTYLRARLHGHSPLGLWHLGKYATPARRNVSRDRTPQRLLPTFHSAKLFREGSRPRRGIREGTAPPYA